MTGEDWNEDLEAALRRLPVHDVPAERAARTRDRCHAALASRRRGMGFPVGRGALSWLEPAAAVAAGIVYLAAAIRASMALLYLTQ